MFYPDPLVRNLDVNDKFQEQSFDLPGDMNAVYDEIIAVIVEGGITPDRNILVNLRDSIKNQISARDLLLDNLPIYPEMRTATNVFAMSDNANGTVRIHAGQQFLMRGWQLLSTADYSFAELTFAHAASKTYHIRFSVANGFGIFDLADGSYNPTAAVDADELFDSTYDDMLVARIVTDGANNPAITQLKNTNKLSLSYRGSLNSADVVADDHGNVGGSIELELFWARSPAYDHFSQAINGYAFGVNGYPTDIFVAKNDVYTNPSAETIFAAVDKSYVRNRYNLKIPVIESKATTGSFAATFETWFVYELSVGT